MGGGRGKGGNTGYSRAGMCDLTELDIKKEHGLRTYNMAWAISHGGAVHGDRPCAPCPHSPFPQRMFLLLAAFSTSAKAPIFLSTSSALLVLETDSAASLRTRGTSGTWWGGRKGHAMHATHKTTACVFPPGLSLTAKQHPRGGTNAEGSPPRQAQSYNQIHQIRMQPSAS